MDFITDSDSECSYEEDIFPEVYKTVYDAYGYHHTFDSKGRCIDWDRPFKAQTLEEWTDWCEFTKDPKSKRMQLMQQHKKTLPSDKFFFITVNPKEDCDLLHFKTLVDTYLKRSFVKNAYYAFEQTGTTGAEMGKHPHIHIIMDKPTELSPKQMITRTYSTFKNVVGSINSIDVKAYTMSLREEKLDYLRGNKWEPSKKPAISVNKVWRDIYKLPTRLE